MKVLKFIAKLLGKIISLFGLLIALVFVLIVEFFNFLIDFSSKKKDEEILSDTETQKRAIERDNKRKHARLDKVANLILDVFINW